MASLAALDCQEVRPTVAKSKGRRSLILSTGLGLISALVLTSLTLTVFTQTQIVLAKDKRLAQVVSPPQDKIVPPPGENIYFPVRSDGQAYVLNVDRTINLTDTLNRFYYDPRWRGEVWTPFDQVDTIERAQRLMSTWPEYNEMNIYRKFNNVSIWFEKYSGFGP